MGTYAVFYTFRNAKGVVTKGQATVIGSTIVKVIDAFNAVHVAPEGASYNVDTVVCLKATD